MSFRSLARRFFGLPEPTGYPGEGVMITGPRKSGPPYVDHHANRTQTAQPLGTARPLGPEAPQRWNVYEGHGLLIATVVEDPNTKRILVRWRASVFPKVRATRTPQRQVWVDIAAFKEDMWDYSRLGFCDLHGLTKPLRVRNTDRNIAAYEGHETPGW